MPALTRTVFDQALAQLSAWHHQWPASAIGLHVNVSSQDLARAGLPEQVLERLEAHALSPTALTLEITETTLMSRVDTAVDVMNRLRDKGVRFSIDDFGTGYSSLAYLGHLPFDSLKVDRSFVQTMGDDGRGREIVKAVVTLAHALGRSVVAEGIETEGQLALLQALDVEEGQGFLLGRPLAPQAATALLAERAA
jgi:EAL domain-containing protein (putative c-di-GMP-specific phosphodiesterase class I)